MIALILLVLAFVLALLEAFAPWSRPWPRPHMGWLAVALALLAFILTNAGLAH
jgi:formate hydrogenlyase subunit 4